MRLILFFDLPVETKAQRRAYTRFVKDIKKLGFYMMQKSVYLKLVIDGQAAASTVLNVRTMVPSHGDIAILTITEKQFQTIEFLLGESYSNVINTDERIVEL